MAKLTISRHADREAEAAERLRQWAEEQKSKLPARVARIQAAAASGDPERVERAAWSLAFVARDALEIIAEALPELGDSEASIEALSAIVDRERARARQRRQQQAHGGRARAEAMKEQNAERDAKIRQGFKSLRADRRYAKRPASDLHGRLAKEHGVSPSTVRRALGRL